MEYITQLLAGLSKVTQEDVIGVGALVTSLVVLKLHKSKEKQEEIEIVPLETLRPRRTHDQKVSKKRVYGIDPTKRKTLQPGNHNIVPKGWDEVQIVSDDIREVVPKDTIMQYNFYGSALVMNGRPIVSALPKKLHRCEVTENELLIDNMKYKVHQDTIKELRKFIFQLNR
jgi:hypothetical protein